jgi:hypothetical protein
MDEPDRAVIITHAARNGPQEICWCQTLIFYFLVIVGKSVGRLHLQSWVSYQGPTPESESLSSRIPTHLLACFLWSRDKMHFPTFEPQLLGETINCTVGFSISGSVNNAAAIAWRIGTRVENLRWIIVGWGIPPKPSGSFSIN